jgi:hypothetical protein
MVVVLKVVTGLYISVLDQRVFDFYVATADDDVEYELATLLL